LNIKTEHNNICKKNILNCQSTTTNNNNKLSFKPFEGLKNDYYTRKKHYNSDWTDGFNKKSISSILFMFFACLAPIVAFGGLTSIITEGKMGIIDFIVSCGTSGMFYAVFSGQPLTLVGPTGLTLAFVSALHRFTVINKLSFFAIYSWTGIWTSFFLALSSILNLSYLIKYCTRFTDDCFNALLSINFLYEAGM
jgi:hypothetical protein